MIYKYIYIKNNKKVQLPKKSLKNPTSLRKSEEQRFSTKEIEIDFLLDSGAESNVINIPTWNEKQTLYPK